MITNSTNLNKIATAYNNTTTQTKEMKNILPDEQSKGNTNANTNMDTIEIGKGTKESFGTYKIDRQKLNQIKQDFS